MAFTFGSSSPGSQSLFLTLLCVTFLACHLVVVPLRSQQSQTLQTVLLFCLVGLALSELPFAVQLEKGTPPNVAGVVFASDTVAQLMHSVFGVGVPALAVAWAYVGELVCGGPGGCRRLARLVPRRWYKPQALLRPLL